MIPLRKQDDLSDWIERAFGHVFVQPALCRTALTHRSAGTDHNERLEFLGDAILNCTVARMLYDAQPQADEGALSRLRASLVSGETLAQIASELSMGEHLHLGPGELKSGGFRRGSILADSLEAMLGAIFLDAGFDAAAAAVGRIMTSRLSGLPSADTLKDPKTRLQEMLQARGVALPTYTLTAATGDHHAQVFTVTCEIPVFGVVAVGEGASRRRAEQLAAAKVMHLLPSEVRNAV
ncbi:MAG TPA: ribonuclease III [Steroidobacteraceae bacterium]